MKTIKIKVGDLLNASDSLARIKEQRLPIKLTFLVKRFVDKLKPEFSNAVNSRKVLFEKYGVQKGTLLEIPPANQAAYQSELSPLMITEIEVTFDPMPWSSLTEEWVDDFGQPRRVVITESDLTVLEPFIDLEM